MIFVSDPQALVSKMLYIYISKCLFHSTNNNSERIFQMLIQID